MRALPTAPSPTRIAAIADRVAALAAPGANARRQNAVALVLSTYPGKRWQMAHAVGLDALASAEAMLPDLASAGYDVAPRGPWREARRDTVTWPLADYRDGAGNPARGAARRS